MYPNHAALGDQGAVRRGGLLLVFSLVLLTAMLSSCKDPANPQGPTAPPTTGFTVRGIVVETSAEGGDAIGAVLVEITSGDSAGTSTTTNAMGQFSINGLSGTLNLRFSKEGYVATGQTVQVTAEVFLNVTMERDESGGPGPGPTFTLSGVVSRKQGEGGPIGGALVEVIEGEREGDSSTTDGLGRYSIPGLSDEIRVRASGDGFEALEKDIEMTEDTNVVFELITPPQVSMCLDLDDEELYITNDDTVNELILTGWFVREVTDGNRFTFVEDRECRASMNGFTLAPGATVIITSGDDPEHDPPNSIAGWCEAVWENDGDEARLVNPDTGLVARVEGRANCNR